MFGIVARRAVTVSAAAPLLSVRAYCLQGGKATDAKDSTSAAKDAGKAKEGKPQFGDAKDEHLKQQSNIGDKQSQEPKTDELNKGSSKHSQSSETSSATPQEQKLGGAQQWKS